MAHAADSASIPPNHHRYRWFAPGDINGFFGLVFDNMAVLSLMAFILIVVFKFPADIVFQKMIPGTAFGVLFGDLVYTWMAFRLARRTGNSTVTAMPLGLDTPSTIGIALTVLGPAFLMFKGRGMDEQTAGLMTWQLGMATMVLIGVIKLIFSFLGGWVQKIVPQAGLLGSLAGIGLALIGFLPLIEVFGAPLIGMLALGVIIYGLIAAIRLPKGFPGVLASVLIGTILYYLLAPAGLLGIEYKAPAAYNAMFSPPLPTLGFVPLMGEALKYFPIAFPFAILTVIGGINVTESARVAGDSFNTKSILLTEAIATLLAGVCGGVAQSTPYIGQPAYKQMGCRAGYTLLTGLVLGIGGMFGLIGFLVELIPRAVIAPILIFVGIDIMCQAFLACPARHAPAVAFAYFPTVARLLSIKLSNPEVVPPDVFNRLMTTTSPGHLPEMLVTIALGNGFILTGMLWGAFVVKIIDRHLGAAAIYLFICAGLTFFGIIHSADPSGVLYLPWNLSPPARHIPYQFSLGYAALGAMVLLLRFSKEAHEPVPATVVH